MSIAELITSIANKVKGIKDNVLAAYDAVASKNGEVPSEKTMENLPAAITSTHDTLEELTITQNGEYTPQEGVDGFSKVVANVVPTKKVVLQSRTQISNTQIIDGYWAGELVDTSMMTDMYRMFRYCSLLQNIDVSNWDVSNVTNMNGVFEGCQQLQSLDVSNWDVGGVTTMENMFLNCQLLQTLDVSSWDVSNVTNMNSMFRWCSQLQTLDVSNWDVSNVTDMFNMFSECSQLQTLIGNRTIDDVLANNISALNGLKVALLLSYTILDRASLRALINGLADLTGQTTQTLTLGPKLRAKLTEEDIAITTSKNWTIV